MTKETKNKNGLKKNKSSYMFFCIEERDNIKKDKPELNNKELVVELGHRWTDIKEHHPDRLNKFQKMADEDKERYIKEKGNLKEVSLETTDLENESKKVKKTKKKDKVHKVDKVETSEPTPMPLTNESKKTKINGYLNFCKKMRETVKKNNPDMTLAKNIQKELAKLWKELSESEKETYKNE
jgi:HMG (high mobility group) box